MQVLDYTKHSVFVPFLVRRSNDSKLVIEDGRLTKLPVKPVVDLINLMKDEIQDNGFILLGDDVIVIDIETDIDGWPIGLYAIFMESDYEPNMFMGFDLAYDGRTGGDVDINKIMICDDDYDLFY